MLLLINSSSHVQLLHLLILTISALVIFGTASESFTSMLIDLQLDDNTMKKAL